MGLQNSLTPVEMAKIILTFHSMRVTDKELTTALHDNILLSLQNHSNLISDEDLLEVFEAMCACRCGTREMHKTIEYILSFRLLRIAENRDILKRFYDVGNKSGLITPATLQSIGELL
jgi:hypothetical protein